MRSSTLSGLLRESLHLSEMRNRHQREFEEFTKKGKEKEAVAKNLRWEAGRLPGDTSFVKQTAQALRARARTLDDEVDDLRLKASASRKQADTYQQKYNAVEHAIQQMR